MAGRLSPATREQIRAANDIVDVIGSAIPLKRAGAGFVALCPFHKEKTPSFHVNPHKQTFHCFGCHKGGDVFTFIQEHENIDFMEAILRLAERAKIPLAYESGGTDSGSRDLKQTLLQIHDQITQRWQSALASEPGAQIARDYLAQRGVSPEAIKLFRIGHAPDLWDDTVNWAKSKGYEPALVEKAGLILRKEGSQHHYDRFRGRLMFPICDEQGRVIGFSGRILSGDEKSAKYVNSPETPIFTKSRVFFGLDKSKRSLLDAGYAIVCEGQLDLITSFMAGVQNIVAPQGTAFTADHARILKRYVEEVVLCFDSDEAGQNATVRSLDSLLASGLAVRVALMPRPHDPDSFIKAMGGAAFRELIEGAKGFFDYYLNRLCTLHDVTTDKGRLAVLRGMSDAVHKSDNRVLIDNYARETALRLGVPPDAVRDEFRKSRGAKSPIAAASEPTEEGAKPSRPATDEYRLLKLLLLHEDLVDWVAVHLDPGWILHDLTRAIIERRLAAAAQRGWSGVSAFVAECETPEMRSLITEAVTVERPLPNPAQQLTDVTLKLRNQFIDRQRSALMLRINQPGASDAERIELLRQHQKLLFLKQQPLAVRQAASPPTPSDAKHSDQGVEAE